MLLLGQLLRYVLSYPVSEWTYTVRGNPVSCNITAGCGHKPSGIFWRWYPIRRFMMGHPRHQSPCLVASIAISKG